jgi:hypothetical protein
MVPHAPKCILVALLVDDEGEEKPEDDPRVHHHALRPCREAERPKGEYGIKERNRLQHDRDLLELEERERSNRKAKQVLSSAIRSLTPLALIWVDASLKGMNSDDLPASLKAAIGNSFGSFFVLATVLRACHIDFQ